jgi:hypothetical protein
MGISFFHRFYKEDGTVIDDLDPESPMAVLQGGGEEDSWTVTDFRPIREAVFYFRQFVVNDTMKDILERFDLVNIPTCRL